MTVWPRIAEILLGLWLVMSPVVLGPALGGPAAIVTEHVLGVGVVALAAAAIAKHRERLRILIAITGIWLIAVPYFSFRRPGPPLAQSDIIVGLLLLMMCVLPTRATEPPESWQKHGEI